MRYEWRKIVTQRQLCALLLLVVMCDATIDWQGQTRLTACLSGAFCSFRLGLRQQACGSKTKNHSKIHRWQVRSSFAGAEMCPDKKRPAENTCRIVKGLDAGWAHFCPSKPCLPLSIDGTLIAFNPNAIGFVNWQYVADRIVAKKLINPSPFPYFTATT